MTTQERADFGSSRSLPGLTPASPATPFAKARHWSITSLLTGAKAEQPATSDSLPGFARVTHACSCRERSRLDAHLT